MPAADALDAAALAGLIAARPPLEAFGPNSDRPFLLVANDGIDAGTADWLMRLPCPVIGIGPAADMARRGTDTSVATPADAAPMLRNIGRWPMTAMLLVQHLRATAALPPAAALVAESLAYATAQGGAEFRRWREAAPALPPLLAADPPLLIDHDGNTLVVTLADPGNRNAIGTAMRDALCEALDLALATGVPVRLQARGRSFSTGGAVSEFGSIGDTATAHWIRSLRLPATRLARLDVGAHVSGSAIGAGLEIAAFARRLTAGPSAWFQLPELRYGLVPGAGGTVSLPARIGRHRTAWLALTMARVPAHQALAMGLVDEILPD